MAKKRKQKQTIPQKLTAKEAAKLVNRSAYTVQRWCRTGVLTNWERTTGFSPRYLIDRDELLRLGK